MSLETEDPNKRKNKNTFLAVNGDLCEVHECVAAQACPEEAMSQKGTEPPTIDISKCTMCEVCLHFCDYGALELHTMDLSFGL